MQLPPTLDHRGLEPFGFDQFGGLDSPSDLMSMIGDLFPVALCGRSSLKYLRKFANFSAESSLGPYFFDGIFVVLRIMANDQQTWDEIMRNLLMSTIAISLLGQAAIAETFSADVWADNWFAFNVNGVQVAEDSVSITTERSFNAESFLFEAQRPFTIGLIAKDFKENDTGLEYIGSRKQQMGDGGVILQVMDSSGNLVAVSDEGWQCMVIHEAPLNKSCESESNPVAGQGACGFEVLTAPADWNTTGFDASNWSPASVYSENEVGPKDGYDRVRWDSSAELIWGPDLETNNTVLCRLTVN